MQIVRRQSANSDLLSVLKNALQTDRSSFVPDATQGNLGRMVTGLESFDDAAQGNLSDYMNRFQSTIERDVLAVANASVEADAQFKISENGFKAASIVMAAYGTGNIKDYAQKLRTVAPMHGGNVVAPELMGAHGSLDYTDTALEAFDESEVVNYLPETIDFNMQAVRQSPFSEMFYRTIVLAPTQAGLEITVARPVIYPDLRRDYTTDYKEWNMRNLLDAVIDHTILDSNSVDATPIYMTTPTDTSAYFTPAADITPSDVVIDGSTYKTAPLLVGKKIPLLQLSTNPGVRRAGDPDFTDGLVLGLALRTLYLKVENVVETVPTTTYIPLNVARLPFTSWLKSPEGKDRDLILNFDNQDIAITSKTTDTTGADLSAGALSILAGANADKVVRLHVRAMGNGNLQFGDVSVVSASVEIAGVYAKDSTGFYQNEVTGATATSIVSGLGTLSIVGFDVDAKRSLLNKHVRGDIVDTMPMTEKFPILMHQPVTSLRPVSSPATGDSAAIDTLIAACRVRTDNNAMTKLLNYIDSLEALQPNANRQSRVPDIEGTGRWFVRPYFETKDVDLLNVVNSIKTHERAQDVSAALVNEIRRWTYSALKISGFAAACEYMPGGAVEVLIGTDRELLNHIQINGDTRLVGINVDYQLQASDDQRIYNKIVVALSRKSTGEGIDVLGSGIHAWVPPVVGTTNIDRQGRTARELTVQLRNRHINNVPIMGVFNIQHLAEAVTEYNNYRSIDVTP